MVYDVKATAERINSHLPAYLQSMGINIRQNFRCLNPDHPDVHPSMHYMSSNKVHCFACGVTYDLIELIGIEYGLTDRKSKFKKACEIYGENLDAEYTPALTAKPAEEKSRFDDIPFDYSDYYEKTHAALDDTDYHRGLSREVLDRFNIGFDPEWRHPKAVAEGKNPPSSPRLIIPTSKFSYVARDTRTDLTETQAVYKKQKVGKTCLFNAEAIMDAKTPVFIVEGEIDAMSIIDVGGTAVGLGSLNNINKLLEYVAIVKPSQKLLIAFDNEESVPIEKAVQKLRTGLAQLNIKNKVVDIYGDYKDANEFLMKDRNGLRAAVIRNIL